MERLEGFADSDGGATDRGDARLETSKGRPDRLGGNR